MKEINSENIVTMAQDFIEPYPSQDEPTFKLIMGGVDLCDIDNAKKLVPADMVFLHVLDTFTLLTDKDKTAFSKSDINMSMFLASGIAIEAYYKRCSIALDVGFLEDDNDAEYLLKIMKAMGYKNELCYISADSDTVKQMLDAMSEEEHWQSRVKNDLNRDLIYYLFEDVTNTKFDANTKKAISMADDFTIFHNEEDSKENESNETSEDNNKEIDFTTIFDTDDSN